MDEQRLHMYPEAHSNTLRTEFQGSFWMDVRGMWLHNSFYCFSPQMWHISKTFFTQSYWSFWPGTRPGEKRGYGSGASNRQVHVTAVSHSIPRQSDAHKDICLVMLNRYHLSHNKVCCRLTMVQLKLSHFQECKFRDLALQNLKKKIIQMPQALWIFIFWPSQYLLKLYSQAYEYTQRVLHSYSQYATSVQKKAYQSPWKVMSSSTLLHHLISASDL